MNIKDFLIDNYIWILVIILITIITIIGFLADKKKGEKQKEQTPSENKDANQNMVANPVNMQYQGNMVQGQNVMSNTMGVNQNNGVNMQQVSQNQQIQPNNMNMPNVDTGMISGGMNPNTTEPTPVAVMPNNTVQINNPQPVETVAPSVEPEPIYQPLSEQKPHIPPRPVPDFGHMPNNNQQQVENMMSAPLAQNTPYMNTQVQPIPVEPMNQMIQPNMQMQAMPQQMYNNMNTMNNAQVQQNLTVPTPMPSNAIPVPQPVMPQHIMPPQYPNNQMMAQNYNNQMPQHVVNTPKIPSAPGPHNQPINFVYGPQDNNPNMQ